MKRHLVPLLAGAAVLLGGCGSAGNLGADGTDGSAEPAPSTPDPHPIDGPWPAYDVADYTYTLRVACFCADGGVPVVVTVRVGKAIDAVYAHTGRGHAAGDSAGDWMRVSINDVIDAANTEDAFQVRVRWPEGQDYPASVWVDPDANAADEEIGYSIRKVSPA